MFKLPSFRKLFWERDKAGDNWYLPLEAGDWGLKGTNLEIAQNHPILTPALIFVSKLFSQARFSMVKDDGTIVKRNPLLTLLNNPNYFQTKMDLLESLMFTQIANGVAVLYKKPVVGMPKELSTIYVLNYELIKWPTDFKTKLSGLNKNNKIGETVVRYDIENENLDIKLKDLMFFYDMPNSVKSSNMYKNGSRLDGLKQTLVNTNDSLIAKNIILKTNGKELLTGSKEGFPLSDDEKQEAQNLFNANYGLSRTRSRGLITKANVTWKSLHIALRDLGLDESVKVDGNIIYTALHIPKDILSLEAKKTTYENGKQSMISYIQNEMQENIDSFCEVMNKCIPYDGMRLVGSYDHLPVMQYVMAEKYAAQLVRANALTAMLSAGIPEEVAMAELGFPKNVKLTQPSSQTTTTTPTSTTQLQIVN